MFGLYFQVIVHNGGKSGQDLRETEVETVENSAGWLPRRLPHSLQPNNLANTQPTSINTGEETD